VSKRRHGDALTRPAAALPTGDILDEGEARDEGGRPVRNRRIKPCGCWQGEVYRDVPRALGGGGRPNVLPLTAGGTGFAEPIPMEKAWVSETVLCSVHSDAAALRALQMASFTGAIGDMKFKGAALPPDSPGARTLARADSILAAERELHARLGVKAPPGPLDYLPGGSASPLPPLPAIGPSPHVKVTFGLSDGRAALEAEVRALYPKIMSGTATAAEQARFAELAAKVAEEP
jgi:hypothetical protein